jgi:hypothetical protein
MKNITDIILTYREALMQLWNTYFLNNPENDIFQFETDKAFSRIRDGLFESLVQAKIFPYSRIIGANGYWDIEVKPKEDVDNIIIGKKDGLNYNWKSTKLISKSHLYKFIELFDWDQEGKMNCEFVRVRRLDSEIELDCLFKIDEVEFYIKK